MKKVGKIIKKYIHYKFKEKQQQQQLVQKQLLN